MINCEKGSDPFYCSGVEQKFFYLQKKHMAEGFSPNQTFNFSQGTQTNISNFKDFIEAVDYAGWMLLSMHSLIDLFLTQYFWILRIYAYFLLTLQTTHILADKDLKYINLRHIALKWILCIGFHEIKRGFMGGTKVNGLVMVIIMGLCMVFAAYPSRVLKTVHLRYFSRTEKSLYNQSVNDPTQYDVLFYERLLNSLAVLLINLSKYITAFTQPSQRKNIEEALKNLNTVVIDKKCFWSIYEDGTTSNSQDYSRRESYSIMEYLVSGSQLQVVFSQNDREFALRVASKRSILGPDSQMIVKAYGEQCSSLGQQNGGYKPIKQVSIKYNAISSQIEILDLDFGKVGRYLLEQLNDKGQNVLEFLVQRLEQAGEQRIFIKFRGPKDLQKFMISVQKTEETLLNESSGKL